MLFDLHQAEMFCVRASDAKHAEDRWTNTPAIRKCISQHGDPRPRRPFLFKSWNLVGVPQTCIINDGEFQEALPGALDPNIYRDEINKLPRHSEERLRRC